MLDKASYHSVQMDRPADVNSREDMKWLDSRCIPYTGDASEIELFETVKLNKARFTFRSLWARHGYVIIPLLPELNWVATKIVTFELGDMKETV
jgi:hypothetical protein